MTPKEKGSTFLELKMVVYLLNIHVEFQILFGWLIHRYTARTLDNIRFRKRRTVPSEHVRSKSLSRSFLTCKKDALVKDAIMMSSVSKTKQHTS